MACQCLGCVEIFWHADERICLVGCLELRKHILDAKGEQGAGLTKILRHLSFAAHRWESTVSPQRRYVVLQSAIALLLSVRATDVRIESKERALAATRLREMGPKQAALAGLIADWRQDVGALVKASERSDHDIVLSRAHIFRLLSQSKQL